MMPLIPLIPTGFGLYHGQVLQQQGQIAAEWSDILRAAITVGRRNARAVFQHGLHSLFEANYRAYMVKANLTENGRGELVRTQAYKDLDPTEKGAVSYFLSMGLAKLLCEHFFGASWLVHLDVFDGQLNPPLGRGPRPDLVGTDRRGNWVVVEVKGRSNDLPEQVIRDGKAQCRRVRQVNGQWSALRLVAGMYFEGPEVQTRLHDPEGAESDASDLKVTPGKLWHEYYSPIAEAVRTADRRDVREIGQRTYELAYFQNLDFYLGLERDVRTAVERGGDAEVLQELLHRLPESPSTVDEPRSEEIIRRPEDQVQIFRTRTAEGDVPTDTSVGFDGTVVQVGASWSAERLLAPAFD